MQDKMQALEDEVTRLQTIIESQADTIAQQAMRLRRLERGEVGRKSYDPAEKRKRLEQALRSVDPQGPSLYG